MRFQDFTPTANGGHCGKCRKEVVDFTRMTEEEIISYFKVTNGKTCGRLSEHQLRRFGAPSTSQKNIPTRVLGFSFLMAMLPAFSMSAQEVTPKSKTEIPFFWGPEKKAAR